MEERAGLTHAAKRDSSPVRSAAALFGVEESNEPAPTAATQSYVVQPMPADLFGDASGLFG
eukprot:5279-Heterococcus_DN1.PRE.1